MRVPASTIPRKCVPNINHLWLYKLFHRQIPSKPLTPILNLIPLVYIICGITSYPWYSHCNHLVSYHCQGLQFTQTETGKSEPQKRKHWRILFISQSHEQDTELSGYFGSISFCELSASVININSIITAWATLEQL